MLDLVSILIVLPGSPGIPSLLTPPSIIHHVPPWLGSPLCAPHSSPVRLHTRLEIGDTHRPDLFHQPLILTIAPLSMLSHGHRRYHIIARLILLPHLLLLCLTLPSPRIRLQKHLQQRRDRSIRPRPTHLGATLRARVRTSSAMLARAERRISLEGEPFFQTWPAEGVEAVEQGQGLVEDVCADLPRPSSDIAIFGYFRYER